MKKLKIGFIAIVAALIVAPSVFAQEPFIYPEKGQSNEQQEKDKRILLNFLLEMAWFAVWFYLPLSYQCAKLKFLA